MESIIESVFTDIFLKVIKLLKLCNLSYLRLTVSLWIQLEHCPAYEILCTSQNTWYEILRTIHKYPYFKLNIFNHNRELIVRCVLFVVTYQLIIVFLQLCFVI